jgi:hypothetical protein
MSTDPNDIFKLMALGPPNTVGVPEAFRRMSSLIDFAGDLTRRTVQYAHSNRATT